MDTAGITAGIAVRGAPVAGAPGSAQEKRQWHSADALQQWRRYFEGQSPAPFQTSLAGVGRGAL